MCNYITHSLKLVSFIAISLLMLACGPTTKKASSEFASASQNLEALLKQADQAESAQRNPLLVQASGILLANQRPAKAMELLIHIDNRYLDNKQKDTYHLFYAEALLTDDLTQPDELQEKYQASLNHLRSVIKPSDHSIEWQIRYFQTLSDSYLANHNYFEAAKHRIELDDLIDQQPMLEENNEKIWFAISQIKTNFLAQLISGFNSPRVNGWLEIVHINQKWGDQPDRLLAQMTLWKQRYPLHPAMVIQPKILQRVTTAEILNPKKIAILLPLSGRFAGSGKMVHDGIIAAHYQSKDAETSPTVSFYDTSKSQSGLLSYQQAIADGADFVIGPLIKKAINEVVLQDTLTTPILLLNTTSNMPEHHQMAFQFVLSIEDEAIQVAHRAWENGYRKAIAFVPDDQRGHRAQVAFKQYFEQLGGELIDSQTYKDIKTLKTDVQNLLRVDASINRKRQLEQILGRNIEFEMRRRKDADVIFMLSRPQQARRIKPFIDFYFALDLPVISTKRVFSGKPNPQLDNDLNGIEFSDIPLYISQQSDILQTREVLTKINPDILKNENGRLFSLGFDAYQILSHISRLQAFPAYRWYGLSGEIGVDEQGLVHRYLTWAKFKKGVPKVTKERLPPVFQESREPLSQATPKPRTDVKFLETDSSK
jgi:outer membrane PBP1 activator LpoA protein